MSEKVAKQIAQESLMLSMGQDRYRKRAVKAVEKQRMSQTGSGASITASTVPQLAEAVKASCDLRKHRKGPVPRYIVELRKLEPAVVALIAARTILDQMAMKKKATAMAVQVGGRIEDELRLRRFKKQDPGSYRNAKKQIENSQNYRYQHKVLVALMKECQLVQNWEPWRPGLKAMLGAHLIELMMQSTELIFREMWQGAAVIVPTQKLLDALMQQDEYLELLHPWFLPSLAKPKPWVATESGGYFSYDLSLVKNRNAAHSLRSEGQVPSVPSRTILEALNAIQETPWRVNRDVLEVVETLWSQPFAELPSVPSREPAPPVLRPADLPFDLRKDDMDPVQLEMLTAYKHAKAQNIEAEVRRSSQLLTSAQIKIAAHELREQEAFYFPHQLDWRGRAYAVPIFLSPQGPDLSRGLLEFAEGKPLADEDGIRWFLVTGANHFGVDKVSFADRVQWVTDNHANIVWVGQDPLACQWWKEASEPYQFLSWCFEYADWWAAGGGTDFVSHKVVGQDGSCNGLQHFSAMLRDERGGEAVNLTSSETPQDIYQEVCDVVIEKLEVLKRDWFIFGEHKDGLVDVADSEGDVLSRMTPEAARDAISRHSLEQSLARQWLRSGLLDRAAVKRQVMTLPYGATRHGMQDMLVDHLATVRDSSGGVDLPFADPWSASLFLTGLIYESIGEVVVAASTAMGWLQKVAQIAAKKGLPLHWRTPHGFVVTQAYRSTRKTQIRTQICGHIRLTVREFAKAIDKKKQASGISPNFVHALDSCHMMETVAQMGQGASWAVVHDSFGCHAADSARLARVLRHTFVELYENHDVLEELRRDISQDLGLVLPDPPPKGSLDIRQVLESDFFFG